MAPPPPPRPEHFLFWTEEKLRIADTDMNGHINNGAIGAYCEAGRAELMKEIAGPTQTRSVTMAVARVEIDYLRELYYPGRVRVGTAVLRVGNSSITVRQGVFLGVAASQSVMVILDLATRRPSAIPTALREALARLTPAPAA
jgi:acyl-CoA thioester hydrolase